MTFRQRTLPSPETVESGAAILRSGGLVAFPTETVYGLGADATSPSAVARLFTVKGRPQFNPLIAHILGLEEAAAEGIVTPNAERLAQTFWPGPLTLVLARQRGGRVCDLACAGLASIGLRVPDNLVARALMQRFGGPIAAPSANRSGHVSPTKARHVEADLGAGVDLVLDGGPCAVGIESTIVACLDETVRLLRPGGLDIEAIEDVLGRRLDPLAAPSILAPGMLASHYAPNARLRLDARDLRAGEIGLDFGGRLPGASLDLSRQGDLREAAASLYASLRRLDADRPAVIAVATIPTQTSLGAAIMDRLRRAAAPRP